MKKDLNLKLDDRLLFFVLVGLTVLLVGAIGYGVYETNQLLTTQSTKLVNAKAKVADLNNEQTELNDAKKDISKYSGIYNIARTIVPQSKDQAQAVRQIADLANQNGVYLQSITFPESTLGSSTASTSTGIPATATPSPVTEKDLLSQLQPVPKIAGVYDLQLIVSSGTQTGQTTTYAQMISFLQGLETNRLTAVVSSIDIAPINDTTDPTSSYTKLSFNLTLNIYIKPESTK